MPDLTEDRKNYWPFRGYSSARAARLGGEKGRSGRDWTAQSRRLVCPWGGCIVPGDASVLTPRRPFQPSQDCLKTRMERFDGMPPQLWGTCCSGAKTAVPALTELLRDRDREIRQAAAEACGTIGPEAKTAIPPSLSCSMTRMDRFGRRQLRLWRSSRSSCRSWGDRLKRKTHDVTMMPTYTRSARTRRFWPCVSCLFLLGAWGCPIDGARKIRCWRASRRNDADAATRHPGQYGADADLRSGEQP